MDTKHEMGSNPKLIPMFGTTGGDFRNMKPRRDFESAPKLEEEAESLVLFSALLIC